MRNGLRTLLIAAIEAKRGLNPHSENVN